MFARVVNILEILNIPAFWMWFWFWIYQNSEYARVPNMKGFWICQGSEYTRVLNIPKLHGLLNVPEYPLIIPENAWLSLNMLSILEHTSICANMAKSVWLNYLETPCLLKSLLTYFNKVYSFKEHEVTILFSCRDFKRLKIITSKISSLLFSLSVEGCELWMWIYHSRM